MIASCTHYIQNRHCLSVQLGDDDGDGDDGGGGGGGDGGGAGAHCHCCSHAVFLRTTA